MNLQTRYLGLRLKSPLVASASPLSRDLDGLRRLEDAGASAVTMFSLFSEQLEHRHREGFHQFGTDPEEEHRHHAPEAGQYAVDPEGYLSLIQRAKATIEIPVLASLNVARIGDWVRFAPLLQQAGADALELNIYRVGADADVPAEIVERQILDAIRVVRGEVSLPIAVKLMPYYTSLSNFARSLTMAGADGLTLFGWLYQPDFDLTNVESIPHREPGEKNDSRLPLHWTSMLYGRLGADIAVSGGLRNHVDALKAIAAGGAVASFATEILRRGVGRFTEIEYAMANWLERNGYTSLSQIQGSMSKLRVTDPASFARLAYIREIQSYRPAVRISRGR